MTVPKPYRPPVGHNLTPPLIPMSPSDYRVLHDAQRAVLFALMEKRHEPFTAKEILEACGLAVRYEPDDGVRLESDTAPGPDWGHLDDPFLRGGKQRHENGKGAE